MKMAALTRCYTIEIMRQKRAVTDRKSNLCVLNSPAHWVMPHVWNEPHLHKKNAHGPGQEAPETRIFTTLALSYFMRNILQKIPGLFHTPKLALVS
jgi:hypothetical protein